MVDGIVTSFLLELLIYRPSTSHGNRGARCGPLVREDTLSVQMRLEYAFSAIVSGPLWSNFEGSDEGVIAFDHDRTSADSYYLIHMSIAGDRA